MYIYIWICCSTVASIKIFIFTFICLIFYISMYQVLFADVYFFTFHTNFYVYLYTLVSMYTCYIHFSRYTCTHMYILENTLYIQILLYLNITYTYWCTFSHVYLHEYWCTCIYIFLRCILVNMKHHASITLSRTMRGCVENVYASTCTSTYSIYIFKPVRVIYT